MEKLLGRVVEWREKVEENMGQESEFPATPEGAPEVVCCYGYKNHRAASAI